MIARTRPMHGPLSGGSLTGAVARRRARERRAFTALGVIALGATLLALGHGATDIGFGTMLGVAAVKLGVLDPGDIPLRDTLVLTVIRAPRAVMGFVAGAALAAAGAALQGLFRNPLADPALIGVSNGAALGAVAVIVLGDAVLAGTPSVVAPFVLPACAFLGGFAATVIVYRIARRDGQTDISTMLLAGIAINAIAAAGIGLFMFASTDQQLRELSFWLLGSLGGVTWTALLPGIVMAGAALVLLSCLIRPLNALLLGEVDARHLGVDVETAKRLLIAGAALATGAVVSVTGVIGFVGLVVPHLVRLAIGPDHRVLLPASMLLGGALLLVADTAARTVLVPAELPIGILTSCLGGPFFLWLLLRRRAWGLG